MNINAILNWKNLTAALIVLSLTGLARADSISLTGTIKQSTADTSIPAVNNASLNKIADGDTYTAVLNFTGGISAPGTYGLSSLSFTDTSAGASESGFLASSLTITEVGTTDQFSLLGCLASCTLGNELDLDFSVPVASLNSSAIASAIPALLPMDLLEDGGDTDIQGTVHLYSYKTPVPSSAPEPASLLLIGSSLIVIGAARCKRAKQ